MDDNFQLDLLKKQLSHKNNITYLLYAVLFLLAVINLNLLINKEQMQIPTQVTCPEPQYQYLKTYEEIVFNEGYLYVSKDLKQQKNLVKFADIIHYLHSIHGHKKPNQEKIEQVPLKTDEQKNQKAQPNIDSAQNKTSETQKQPDPVITEKTNQTITNQSTVVPTPAAPQQTNQTITNQPTIVPTPAAPQKNNQTITNQPTQQPKKEENKQQNQQNKKNGQQNKQKPKVQ